MTISTVRRGWLARTAAIVLGTAIAAQGPRQVQAFAVKPQALEVRSVLQGEVLALAKMQLVPRVTGYIVGMHVAEGDLVERGKPLASLDCPDLLQDQAVADAGVVRAKAVAAVATSAMHTAKRAVEVAEADHHQSMTGLDLAQATHQQAELGYQRIKALRGSGAATVEELESVELRLARARSQIDTAKAAVSAAEARVGAAETQVALRKSEIGEAEAGISVAEAEARRARLFVSLATMKSPYASARVTRQLVDAGNLAIADRTALLELMDISRVRIRFPVARTEASRVAPGSAVKLIRPRTLQSKAATVTRISGVLDPLSRTMMAEVELDNRDGSWTPGALVRVDLLVEKIEAALLMPGRGLVKSKGAAHVWLAVDGQARKVEVKVGFNRGRLVQIIDGLQAGAKVLVAGFSGLADGDAVVLEMVQR